MSSASISTSYWYLHQTLIRSSNSCALTYYHITYQISFGRYSVCERKPPFVITPWRSFITQIDRLTGLSGGVGTWFCKYFSFRVVSSLKMMLYVSLGAEGGAKLLSLLDLPTDWRVLTPFESLLGLDPSLVFLLNNDFIFWTAGEQRLNINEEKDATQKENEEKVKKSIPSSYTWERCSNHVLTPGGGIQERRKTRYANRLNNGFNL